MTGPTDAEGKASRVTRLQPCFCSAEKSLQTKGESLFLGGQWIDHIEEKGHADQSTLDDRTDSPIVNVMWETR